MPRMPRMYLSGVPSHVIQRCTNREACFFAQQDYLFYLSCLGDACDRYHVAVHAYVLMTNHVHLLMTPDNQEGVSRVMQSIGRRYVQYINKEYRRCGTLSAMGESRQSKPGGCRTVSVDLLPLHRT